MKTIVMCMLAVVSTASCLTAQDTLTVRSERTVDVCSSEKRWLIAPTLGRVKFQDSLMSFDITIGYDTSVTRPTDVLTEGTLSANLDFKPTMNLVVKGEMRIAGFNIITPMVGDKPIFAVAGDFKGTCQSDDSLSIPWPPSFNSEFKKLVTIYKLEPIVAIAVPRPRSDVGASIDKDSIKIDTFNETAELDISVLLPSLANVRAKVRIAIADTAAVRVTGISVSGAETEKVEYVNAGLIEVSMKQLGTSQPSVTTTVQNISTAERKVTEITSSLQILDTCTCVRADLTERVSIICENPIVSVSSSVDERNDNLKVTSQAARCHCDHGQTNSINVYATSGQLVATTGNLVEDETFLSIESLPSGAYIVVGSCGGKRIVTMEMK